MDPASHDEVIWYYRLGEQTLGPVAWAEIEELIADTIDARDLLVARGGDQTWMSAAEALDESPEPADAAPVTDAEPEEPAAGPEASAELPPLGAISPGGVTPEPGLGKWIGQAWEMVIEDVWPWIGAVLVWTLLTPVTLGIAGPPLQIGLYCMALKRFDGERIAVGDIFEGFGRFWSAWGLTLLMMVPAVVLMLPFIGIIFAIVLAGHDGGEEIMPFMMMGMYALYPAIYLLMLAVQTIFFYSSVLVADGLGAWEAVTGSWEKVRQEFWSYLGIYIVLTILAGAGAYLCYVGWFVTFPLLPCATVAAYRWHFRDAGAPAA